MSWSNYGSNGGAGAPASLPLGVVLDGHRLFRWTGGSAGVPPTAVLCGSGQQADGVTWPASRGGYLAHKGLPVVVEAGGAFAAGANLQSDAVGRVVQHASGPVVMRALEASSGVWSLVWAVFS